jgi:hypothetical protein
MKWLLRAIILAIVISCAPDLGVFSTQLQALPVSAAEWRLANQAVLKPVPPEWKMFRSGAYARKAWRGDYVGEPPLTVTIYEMPRYPAAGWSAIQQWRVQPGKMAFFKGGYFGIAESPRASSSELLRFVNAVCGALPAGNATIR